MMVSGRFCACFWGYFCPEMMVSGRFCAWFLGIFLSRNEGFGFGFGMFFMRVLGRFCTCF